MFIIIDTSDSDMSTNLKDSDCFDIHSIKCFCLQIDIVQTGSMFYLLLKMPINCYMQSSAVITTQTAVFLHYSTDQQAESRMRSRETRKLNLFQYF